MTLLNSVFQMPRSGRLRNFIRGYKESARFEKISFIPPFFILLLEITLLIHAYLLQEFLVILLTTVLLIISIIEIQFVTREIHEHYQIENFERILTIKLDDFIIQREEKNVKKTLADFLEQYPKYEKHRNKIYHITCQIMETHKEEAWDEELNEKLKKFIVKRKKKNVDNLLEEFLKKYPTYIKYKSKMYEKICRIKADII